MPRVDTVAVTADQWVQITNADVTRISFENLGPGTIRVAGTADGTAPVSEVGTWKYGPIQGERNVLLTDLFPAIAAKRVWVKAANSEVAAVAVNHA